MVQVIEILRITERHEPAFVPNLAREDPLVDCDLSHNPGKNSEIK